MLNGVHESSMPRPLIRVLLVVGILSVSGCSSSQSAASPVEPTPTLTNMSLGYSWTYTDARHVLLTVSGKYSDGTTQDLARLVEWQSSNLHVVTMSDPGVFTVTVDGRTALTANIVGDGTTVVTATYQGKAGSSSLTFPLVF